MKLFVTLSISSILLASICCAGEFIQPQTKNKTDPNGQVQCTIDNMEWDGSNFTFSGTIYNKSSNLTISFVQMTITLKDNEGKEMITQNYEADPSRLEPNESGKVGATISCEERKPALVEFQASSL